MKSLLRYYGLIFILGLLPFRAEASCVCLKYMRFLNPVKTAGEPLLAAVSCLPEGILDKPWHWKTAGHMTTVRAEPLQGSAGFYSYILVWLPGERPGMTGTLSLGTLSVGIYLDGKLRRKPAATIRIVKERPVRFQWSLDHLVAREYGHSLELSGGEHWRPRNGIRILRIETSHSESRDFWQSPLVEANGITGKFEFVGDECGNLTVGWAAGDESLIQVLHWSHHRLISETGWRVKLPYPVGMNENQLNDLKRIMDEDKQAYSARGCAQTELPAPQPVCRNISARRSQNDQKLASFRATPISLDASSLENMRMTQTEIDSLKVR